MATFNWRRWLRTVFTHKPSTITRQNRRQLLLEQLETRLAPATLKWTGAGADNRWSTAGNWDLGRAPQSSQNDTLVFPAQNAGFSKFNTQNDISNLIVSAVTFDGSGYTLTGSPLTLNTAAGTGSIVVSAGASLNTINLNVHLGGGAGQQTQFINVNTVGATLTIGGKLSGSASVELAKTGAGMVFLNNDNSSLAGQITITDGIVKINEHRALGLGSVTVVQQGSQLIFGTLAAPVQESLQLIGSGPTTPVPTSGYGALYNETGQNILAGPVQLDGNATVGAENLSSLTIHGRVSDLGMGRSLTKVRRGNLILDPLNDPNGNTYRGQTIIQDGIITIRHPLALGLGGFTGDGTPGDGIPSGTVVNVTPTTAGALHVEYLGPNNNVPAGSTRQLPSNSVNTTTVGGVQVVNGFIVQNELLTINGPGAEGVAVPIGSVSGALNNVNGHNAWQANVNLWSNNTSVNVSGAVAIGAEAPGGESSTLTINGKINEPNLTSPVPGYTLYKVGAGRVVFTNSNTFSGAVTVVGGALNIRDSLALGSGFSTVTVNNGAALELEADARPDSVTSGTDLRLSRNLRLTGLGPNNTGALRNVLGTNEWVASVVTTGSAIGVEPDFDWNNTDGARFNDFSQLTISGVISGTGANNVGDLTKVGGGELALVTDNTYAGRTYIQQGWITIEADRALGARLTALGPILPGYTATRNPNIDLGETVQPGTFVSAGASLVLRQKEGVSVDLTVDENITLSGLGITHRHPWLNQKGALINLGGHNTITGQIGFAGTAGIGVEVEGFTPGTDPLNPTRPSDPHNQPNVPSELTLTGQMRDAADLVTGLPTAGGLTKRGSQRLVLQGDGTYTGANAFEEGVVRIQSDTALGMPAGNDQLGGAGTIVRNGAALELSRSVATLNGGVSSGIQILTEALTLVGPGNTSANSPNPVGGVPGALIGTLTNVDADNMWRGPVVVQAASGATTDARDVHIHVQTDSRLIIYGNMSDPAAQTAAGLIKTGTGKLMLGGNNSYRGTTDIRAGSITVLSSNALGSTAGGTIVGSAAALETQGNIQIAGEPLTLQGEGTLVAPDYTPTWFEQGPGPIKDLPNGVALGANPKVTGRVTGVAADPSDSNVLYISTASGGAWKTINGGLTWTPMIDDTGAQVQGLFSGAIAIAPHDPRIIYVGLGDPNINTDNYYGYGILKSTDSGETWTLLRGNPGVNGSAPDFDRKTITKIVVDPLNVDGTSPHRIYVAVANTSNNGLTGKTGIWTADTSQPDPTWVNLIATPSSVRLGNNPPLGPGPDDNLNEPRNGFSTFDDYTDLVVVADPDQLFRPGNRFIMFAIGNANGRSPATGDFNNAVYVALDASDQNLTPATAGNLNWFKTDFPWFDLDPNNVRWPHGGNIKVGISNTPASPTGSYTLYASVSYPDGHFTGLGGRSREILRTTIDWTPGGRSTANGWVVRLWSATSNPPSYAGVPNIQGTVARYNMAMVVDQSNPNILYVGGLGQGPASQPNGPGPFMSTDGGASWTDIGVGADGNGPHNSYHSFSLDNQNRLLVATDGGVWRLINRTPGLVQWANLNGNFLNIGQMNGLGVDPDDPFHAFGGFRFNGTAEYDADADAYAWQMREVQDGGLVRVDPTTAQNVYHVRNGWLRRSNDGGQTFTDSLNGFLNTSGLYIPFIIDTANANRLLAGTLDLLNPPTGILHPRLQESSDGGRTWQILGDSSDFGGTGAARRIVGIATATFQGEYNLDPGFRQVEDIGRNRNDNKTIYVALANGEIYVTKNGGQTWLQRNGGLPPSARITDIQVDPRNRDTAFVTLNGFAGSQGNHVFRTTDGGQNWEDISSGLPDVPTWKMVIDPRNGTFYVGNDHGVYVSVNEGATWERFGAGMPRVQVRELILNQSNNTLAAGTYGRGMFTAWLPDVLAPADQTLAGALRAVSGTAVWTGSITLKANTTISANGTQEIQNGISTAQLQIRGSIGDDGTAHALAKIGIGDVALEGANTYTGVTEVRDGVLIVRNPLALGASGSAGGGTIVNLGTALHLQSSIQGEALDLYGNGITINGHNTGALRSVSNINTYSGPINLRTSSTIGVDSGSVLTITGPISGATSDLAKELTGTLILAPDAAGPGNTYGGVTDVIQGVLRVADGRALGSTAGATQIRDGAQLQLQGGITVTGETLNLSGTGVSSTGALLNAGGDNTWAGPVNLTSISADTGSIPTSTVFIGVSSTPGSLTINGPVGETNAAGFNSFGLTKIGVGKLVLQQDGTYSGLTRVLQGTVNIQSAGALGSVTSGTEVSAGAALELQTTGGVVFDAEPLVIHGSGIAPANAGALRNVAGNNEWTGTVLLGLVGGNNTIGAADGTDLTVSGLVSGAAGANLNKRGAGSVSFPIANAYQGFTTVSAGVLNIGNAGALGAGGAPTANGTRVLAGATLQLEGGITMTAEDLFLNGFGHNGQGALNNAAGANTWARDLVLETNAGIGVTGASDTLTIDAVITDAGLNRSLTKSGPGTLHLTGTTANTYTGLTQVNGGSLELNKAAGTTAIRGNLIIGDGDSAPISGPAAVRWLANDQVFDASQVRVNSDGTLNLNDMADLIAGLTVNDGFATTGNAGDLTVGGLTMTGGTFSLGTAVSSLNLNGDVTATSSAAGPARIDGLGAVNLGTAPRTFTVTDGPQGADLHVLAPIDGPTGSTLNKAGNGLLQLDADNTYQADTFASGGTVRLGPNGNIGNVLLNGGTVEGGTVDGTSPALGHIGAISQTAAGGRVQPGSNGIGMLTVNGDIAWTRPTNFVVQLDVATAGAGVGFDQLVVNGNINLGGTSANPQNGANIVGFVTPNVQLGDSFVVIRTIGGTVQGKFAQQDKVFVGGAKFAITYTSNTVVLTRVKADATIGLASTDATSEYGQEVSFVATVTPEGGAGNIPTNDTVTFRMFNSANELIEERVEFIDANNRATFTPLGTLAVGTYTVQATFNGDANFNAAGPATVAQTVTKADTAVGVQSSANPAVYGEDVTLTATVARKNPGGGLPPTGTVTFVINPGANQTIRTATVDQNGRASTTLSGLSVNNHSIQVTYSGDPRYNAPATPATFTQTVNRANTSVVVGGPSSSALGTPVTFTATVSVVAPGTGSPTGSVTFKDGNTTLGNASLDANGVATFTIPSNNGPAMTVGTHNITATYNGDPRFATDVSDVFVHTVNKGTTATAFEAVNPPSGSAVGQEVTFTIRVTPEASGIGTPTGNVTLFIDNNAFQTQPLDGSGRVKFTTNQMAAGPHTVRAVYNSDAKFESSSTADLSYTVGKITTTTTVVSSQNPSTLGQSVTFRAVVGRSFNGQAMTGTVTFIIDGVERSPEMSVNSSREATFTVTDLSAGNHTVVARYNGDANHAADASDVLTQVVSKAASKASLTVAPTGPVTYGTTLTFSVDVDPATTGATSNPAPTGTANLVVDGVTRPQAVTLDANGRATFQVSDLPGGTHTVTVQYNGDENYAAVASNAVTVTVNRASASIAASSNDPQSNYGQTVTWTATVSSPAGTPSGTVTFKEGNTVLGQADLVNGTATLQTSTLAVGSHTITATYNSDGNFSAAGTTFTQVVDKAGTTTVVNGPATAPYGAADITATVTAVQPGGGVPTGTVIFFIDTVAQDPVALVNGVATLPRGAVHFGAHGITATYQGTANYEASSDLTPLSHLVTRAGTTIASFTSSDPSTVYGQAVTFTVDVDPASPSTVQPRGQVTFTIDGTTTRTATLDADGKASLQVSDLGTGSHNIVVRYDGNTDFAASNTASLTQTVEQASTTIGVVADDSPSTLGQPVTFTATVAPVAPGGGVPTGTVTFTIDGVEQAPVEVGQDGRAAFTAEGLTFGSHTVTAAYSGDDNFAASTVTVSHTVLHGSGTTLTTSRDTTVYGQPVTLTAAVTADDANQGDPTGTVTFRAGNTILGTVAINANGVATLTVSTLPAGSYALTATYDGDATFDSSTSPTVAHTVNKANASVAVTAPDVTFGQAVTVTATVGAVAPGAGTPTGNVTLVIDGQARETKALANGSATFTVNNLGAGDHTVVVTYAGSGNYNEASSAPDTVTVNPIATTTRLSSNRPSGAYVGQQVTFTATVTAGATGTVTFIVNGARQTVAVTNGRAVLTTTLPAGMNRIQAVYNGSPSHRSSASAVLSFPVARTALVFSPLPRAVRSGSAFRVQVQYRNPDGSLNNTFNGLVQIAPNNAPSGGSFRPITVRAVNGVATFAVKLLRAGNYTLRAVASGQNAVISPVIQVVASQLVARTSTGGSVSTLVPFGLTVTAADATGARAANFHNVPVTLRVISGPQGGAIQGNLRSTMRNGQASFSNLRITRSGTYLVEAVSGHLVYRFQIVSRGRRA